ncbi:MAG TPA: hypothetical protein VN446_08065 [Candidatus Acidoferrum sp.]|nr:hypothetical protein [Candidatus Acidoferrum sp.]
MKANLYLGFCGEKHPSHEAVETLFGETFEFGSPFVSLSHSGGYVAVLRAPFPCGVDLEVHRPLYRNVAKKFPEEETGDFFTLWTRKEAAAKLYMRQGRTLGMSDMLAIPTGDGGEVYYVTAVRETYTLSAAGFEPFELVFIP